MQLKPISPIRVQFHPLQAVSQFQERDNIHASEELVQYGWLVGSKSKGQIGGAPTGSNSIQSWNSRDPNMESAGPLPQ